MFSKIKRSHKRRKKKITDMEDMLRDEHKVPFGIQVEKEAWGRVRQALECPVELRVPLVEMRGPQRSVSRAMASEMPVVARRAHKPGPWTRLGGRQGEAADSGATTRRPV